MDKLRGLYKQKRRDSKGSDGTASLCDSEDYEQPVEEEDDCLAHDSVLSPHVVVVAAAKKKSVRFSPIARVVCFGIYDQSADNREELWYTSAELSHNKRVAKHFIACSRTLLFQTDANALTSAFYTAHSLSRSMDSFETHELLCNDDSSSSTLFASCHQSTRYLTRGLEDSLCPDVADNRNALARESRLIVVELQGLDDDDGHMVATEYQDLSRASLILARLQGMADAQDVGMLDMTITTNISNPHEQVHFMSKSHHEPEENIHLANSSNSNNNIIEV